VTAQAAAPGTIPSSNPDRWCNERAESAMASRWHGERKAMAGPKSAALARE
jgi:hypothetical protein